MISIVLPVYNAERFLRSTVQMVLAQTCGDWELIAVDDGSTDGTPALLQQFAQENARIQVVSQANGGCASARNTGLAHISSDAEYVIFLDHDDLWEPDALDTLRKVARACQEAVAVIGAMAEVQDVEADALFCALQRKSTQYYATSLEAVPTSSFDTVLFADMAVLNCAITMGQVLIRRDALDKTGTLNLKCVPCDDWELYLRLGMLGPMTKTTQTVIYWRSHATNTSNNRQRMYEAELSVRHCMLARPDLAPEQRRMVRNGFQLARKRIAVQKCGYARENWKRKRFGEAFRQLLYALRSYARSFQTLPDA